MMTLLRQKKKPHIKVLTGKAAVNFQKLLVLPIKDSEDLLTAQEWEQLDLRCLTLLKMEMLQASCTARGLSKKGDKDTLVQRLTNSIIDQQRAQTRRRQEEEEKYQRQLDMLGGVWFFGSGFAGQLGHGDLESSATPRLIKNLRGRSIAHVYAGFDSDVAFGVSRTGDVYVWGKRTGPTGLPPMSSLSALVSQTYGHEGDLGVAEDTKDISKPVERQVRAKGESFSRTEATEEEEEGDDLERLMYTDGGDEEGGEEDFVHPVKLMALCGEGINYIAVGRVHCCATTKDGDVFTWGQNDHCQLGFETVHHLSEAQAKKARVRHGKDSMEPQLWEQTVAETCVISAVDVGTNHTFAVTDKGEMRAFGATFDTTESSSVARSIAKLQVSQVSCGALHAGLVTSHGQAYTWGSGDGGRLGQGDTTSYVNPKLVEALKMDIIGQLACACWHTVAIVLIPPLVKGGVVYTWGSGRLGQLAQGGTQISTSPGLVTDFLTTHALIKKVCAGMYHNVALSVDDEVFTWGSNMNGCLGRPEELGELEESFCAVPGRVEGLDQFVGRPCSIAAGREFTLIATKPYIGPSQAELERRKEEQTQQVESIDRRKSVLKKERHDQLQRIRQAKRLAIIAHLNAHFPKCTICTTGLVCPGFQMNTANPTLCKHCMHDNRKHHQQLQAHDPNVTLAYVTQAVEKLGIAVDFSNVPGIQLEAELEVDTEDED